MKNELFLLCDLDDENYSCPGFAFYRTPEEAEQAAIAACKSWEEDCTLDNENTSADNVIRIVGEEADSFYVTEVKRIDPKYGEYLLLWHHGYYGVAFSVLHQGTLDECQKVRKEKEDQLIFDLELKKNAYKQDKFRGVFDTGTEWEVFSIVQIPEQYNR